MACHSGASPLPQPSTPNMPSHVSSVRTGFLTHKYLMVAILKCLQEEHPRAPASPLRFWHNPAVHRWMREPSAERELTPCIVVREHHHRGDLTVARLALETLSLARQPLADWMRALAPPSSLPDRDTVHLAMAPTLPGVPILVHSIGADGEAFTHMFTEGAWTLSPDDQFLLRAIRYAQLVATAIPLNSEPAQAWCKPSEAQSAVPQPDEGPAPCDLVALGRRYDHIAVHAAIRELGEFRRGQRRSRTAPSAEGAASGGQVC